MRICVLTSLYPSPPRPYEGIFAERRWTGMAGRGHAVQVVHPLPRTPGPLAFGSWGEIRRMPARDERSGIAIRRPRYWHIPRQAVPNARRFARAGLHTIDALKGAFDVVVGDYAWPAAMAAPELRERGVPFFLSGRGSDVLQVAGEAGLGDELAGCLRQCAGWFAVSQDLVGAMDRLAGEERGVLIPNGVDLEVFQPGLSATSRERLGRDPQTPMVLVVGHLIERKDPLLALRAFRAAAHPDAVLVYLGRGPLEERLRSEISALGLENRVELVGERPPTELADWYRSADALLLTSRREGRPNVVLEALASGTPVVATAAGGTGELLTGLPEGLVESREPDVVGKALAAMLRTPPRADSLRALVQDFSWARGLERLEDLLSTTNRLSTASR